MNTDNTADNTAPPPLDLGVDMETFILCALYAVRPYGITELQLGIDARTRINKGVTAPLLAGTLRELAGKQLVTTTAATLGPRHWCITANGIAALQEAGLAPVVRDAAHS